MADPHKTANHTPALGESARKPFNGMADARKLLTPTQALICGCVFIATSIGAVLLAWGFARWNGRIV